MSSSQFRSVFVGRQKEMDECKAALEDVLSGQGRLVMLVGEPGIGKTRSAQELAAYAQTRGAQALWGWCYEEEGAPPYWPWVQPIRSYVQRRDPAQLRSEMGPGAADIACIIPDLRLKLSGLEIPPALEPEQARFRLFDSITTFLKNAGESQPLVIVLDDLHWADKPSLLLLQFLTRQLGGSHLFVVGCYRDVEVSRQHPLFETLAQLNRESVFQRQLLRGLSPIDIGHFIEVTTGIRPPQRLVETIYAHTEGNPFFMKEVVRLLSEGGKPTVEEIGRSQGISIPEGVREVIGQRLNRLSEQCHQRLTTASLIGRKFDFELLGAVTGEVTNGQLLGVIDEALAAHLIEESSDGPGHYQFTHALVQETLAEELSIARRVRLHARIAEVLEALYGVNAEAHAPELAYHFAKAEPVTGIEKFVRYSLLAGERALTSYAYEEAQTLFQRALAAKEGQLLAARPHAEALDAEDSGHGMDSQMAALLFGLGRAQLATLQRHQIQEAIGSLSRAFDYYVAVGDVVGAVTVATFPIPSVAGRLTGIAQLIPRALTLVPPDSHEAARLLSTYVRVLGVEEGDYEDAQEASGRAVAIARHEGDAALEMRTLAESANLDYFHLHFQECVEKSLRVIELAGRTDSPHSELTARLCAASAQYLMGNLEEARWHAAAMLAKAERLRDTWWLASALWRNEIVARLEGAWQAACDFSDRGLTVAPRDPRLLATRVLLEYEVGDFGQGEAQRDRLMEAMRLTAPGPTTEYAFTAMVIPMGAHLTRVVDSLHIAEAAAETVLSSPSVTPLVARIAASGVALMAIERSDVITAQQQYETLENGRGTMLPTGVASIDRLLGLLSLSMGQIEQAIAHFEDALAFSYRAGYRPEYAWSSCDCIDALLQRNAPSDREKATSLLDEALAISRELGMRPLTERLVARLDRLGSQEHGAPAYPAGLTQREVEVLRLIAQGETNQEIGDRLFITRRTVANHVTNILNKTGAANRAGAASYAARHGLVSL